MTQQCCEMTTRQAFEAGIALVFASDAAALRVHAAALVAISQYATVMPTSKIVETMRRSKTKPAAGEGIVSTL